MGQGTRVLQPAPGGAMREAMNGIPQPPLIAGNWKMHGLAASVAILDAVVAGAPDDVDLCVCPPLTLLARFAERAEGRVIVGAQDVSAGTFGARTGDVSAAMLADAGARAAIVGHSERRAFHGETDAAVRAKAEAAIGGGLLTIVCVGESEAARVAGTARETIARQLDGSLPRGMGGVHGDGGGVGELAVAYEPVWAIGTGRVPTDAQIAEVHAMIRSVVGAGVRILYGGSVRAINAAQLLAISEVGGVLVGGASLDAAEFLAIAAAHQAANR